MTKIAVIETFNFRKNNIFSMALRHLTWLTEIRKSRLALTRLDPDRLRDIGITHIQAGQETSRSFWDAPSHWVHKC